MKYKTSRLTVDGSIIRDGKILLIKRNHNPFKNRWALLGGYI
jgi:ADP-ribose pyrophosphatase YjhB (NUDIX family)